MSEASSVMPNVDVSAGKSVSKTGGRIERGSICQRPADGPKAAVTRIWPLARTARFSNPKLLMLKSLWTWAWTEAVGGVKEMYGSGGREQSRGAAMMVVMDVPMAIVSAGKVRIL